MHTLRGKVTPGSIMEPNWNQGDKNVKEKPYAKWKEVNSLLRTSFQPAKLPACGKDLKKSFYSE